MIPGYTATEDVMTLARLAEIRARCEKATKGPWHRGPFYLTDIESRTGRVAECQLMTPQGAEDADFIAHAREDIPALLAALKERMGQ